MTEKPLLVVTDDPTITAALRRHQRPGPSITSGRGSRWSTVHDQSRRLRSPVAADQAGPGW